jgi:tRNA (cytidine/uridine-2'-O-)-methyltransferase
VPIRLALFEPDIPQNAGTIIRLAACLGVAVDLIEPAGFLLGDRQFRRAGLDYLALAALRRFPSWRAYQADREPGRLVLLTTRGDEPYVSFRFRADDVLLLGRESVGVPDAVHAAVDGRLRVPMLPGARSLNVAVAAAMVLGEALRQTGGFPAGEDMSDEASAPRREA